MTMTTRRSDREARRISRRPAASWMLVGAVVAVATLSASCVVPQRGTSPYRVGEMRRSALEYLAEGDPTVDVAQPLVVHTQLDPGDSTLVERGAATMPPQVSHEVESLLPITIDENACLACHLPDAAGEDDIPIPDSHFAVPRVEVARLRSDPAFSQRSMLSYVAGYDQQEEDPSGARYNCVMCHTASAENASALGARP